MKKKIRWILPIAVLLIIAALGTVRFFNNRTSFNKDYVNGNTAGNLYNNGMFCEYDGTVYFANPNDDFKLYSMPSDGGAAKKICDDTVTFLNADDHYIYYAKNNKSGSGAFSFLHWNNNSLCRIKKNGKQRIILDDAPSMYVSLLGNELYYLHYDTKTATTMYKVNIDGSKKEQVEDKPYYTCSTDGKYLYYNGLKKDHNLYSLNTATGNSRRLFDGNCWMPVVLGNTAYYMDCENNYRLTRADLNTKETRTLTDERIDCFNIYGSYIYYARNEEPALCRMKIDGSDVQEIAQGIYTDINITSRYVYFRRLNDPDTIYKTPTTGFPSVTTFAPKLKNLSQ